MTYLPDKERYSTMKYNRCGDSGLKLPAISMGLWHNFGGIDSFENGRNIIRSAFDRGITHFDLANNYGPPPGSAEENFGRIIKADFASYRDEMIISTKAGYYMWPGPYGEWGSKKNMIASLDQSLKRMKLEYVDIFYSHRPDPETPLEETMGALEMAVRQGKTLYVGLSNYDAVQTRKAVAVLKNLGIHCLIYQASYSMLNRRVEDGLLDVLLEEGIGCIAFCPLAEGMLTDKYLHGIPPDSRAAGPSVFLKPEDITEKKLEKIRRLDEAARMRGQTLAQMALAWLFRNGRITSALIGASKVKQVNENAEALNRLDFNTQELDLIEEILK